MLKNRELYCITAELVNGRSPIDTAEQACEGGAQVIQFRHKGEVTDAVLSTARNICGICRKRDVVFIINDHPEMVPIVDADGVHLGQDDMPIAQARYVVGPGKLIGLSTHSYKQAMQASLRGADYVGFGPVYATPTKSEYRPVGLADVRLVTGKLDIPVFAIGGIDAGNVAHVIGAGADRIAVVRAVWGAEDIAGAARAMREHINQAKKEKIFQEI